jgi:hypothetical protein
MARMEKQRDKAAKRMERKLAKEAGLTEPNDLDIELDEFGVPVNRPGVVDEAEAASPDQTRAVGSGPDKGEPPDAAPKE